MVIWNMDDLNGDKLLFDASRWKAWLWWYGWFRFLEGRYDLRVCIEQSWTSTRASEVYELVIQWHFKVSKLKWFGHAKGPGSLAKTTTENTIYGNLGWTTQEKDRRDYATTLAHRNRQSYLEHEAFCETGLEADGKNSRCESVIRHNWVVAYRAWLKQKRSVLLYLSTYSIEYVHVVTI